MSGTAPLPEITGVSGGVAGVEAGWAAAEALAARHDALGDLARDWARLGPQVVAEPDLVASAVFSPLTFARAEAAVLFATVGPEGALGRAAAWEAEAVAVRSAVTGLRLADEAVALAVQQRDRALGWAVGVTLGVTARAALPLVPWWLALPDQAREAAVEGVVEPALRRLEEAAVAHPDVVEAVLHGGGGLVDGVLGVPQGTPLHPDTASGAETLAGLYDDGRPQVRRLDLAPPPGTGVAPRDLAGLLTGLAGVARLSTGASSPRNGTVAVTTLSGPDGRRRHVVDIPGTDDMATTPWSQDHDVRDMGTNLALMAGRPTSYGAGVLEAMAAAGVRPDEPVLLVGHSQGGMQAAALAASDTPYSIGHVVTAGSPLAQVDLPGRVSAISLENHGDLVPLTDGEPNRPAPGHVTLTFDGGGGDGGGAVGHHEHERYIDGAAAADRSEDPSVRAALDELHRAGFLGAEATAETQVFQVTRR